MNYGYPGGIQREFYTNLNEQGEWDPQRPKWRRDASESSSFDFQEQVIDDLLAENVRRPDTKQPRAALT